MKINEKRLYEHIIELAKIGQNEDLSITRFPYTDVEEAAKQCIITYMKEAGLEVRVDAVGNIIGCKEGNNKDAPIIVCGSHFDSVKEGGMFDGCFGILSCIEVLQTMNENNITLNQSVEVIGFKDEEGNRFNYGMIGSRAINGLLKEEDLMSEDQDHITIREAAKKYNYDIDNFATCVYKDKLQVFIELHIEQGKVLEQRQMPIGIVEGIAGLKRYIITIHGESGHSGATPMVGRIDPVQAMSKMIQLINEKIMKYENAVATVGEIHTYPGACNIICDHVCFSLDVRSMKEQDLINYVEEIKSLVKEVEKQGFMISMEQTQDIAPCSCDEKYQAKWKEVFKELNYVPNTLMSGAGHDAMSFSSTCPITMLFIRSQNGRSHCKEEYSSIQDCGIGTQALFNFLVKF
ncbi:MAG: Zn-dependent hydrolase [Erysipelotrichaceae bacterium]